MNKAELVAEIQKKMGKETTKAEAERALEAVIHCMKAGIKKEKNLQLIGFGTFKVVKRAARKGINPQTRKPITIKASETVKFSVSSSFKESL